MMMMMILKLNKAGDGDVYPLSSSIVILYFHTVLLYYD